MGFDHLTPEERRAISSRGGKASQASGKGHSFTSEQAREAGRKGGKKTSADREHMAAIGRMGGKARAKREREAMEARQLRIPGTEDE